MSVQKPERAELPFLKNFKKNLEKMENVSTDFRPPSHWYTTGNYAVNSILSGDYNRGIPQGRVSILAGPSGSGKSFLLSNILKAAQQDGAFILALDSENALDMDYLHKVGVSTDESNFLGIQVVTISDVITILADFIKEYQKAHGKYNYDAPKVVIAVDSLDMLLTETESAHFEAGDQKGDQGQRAKQLKAFLRTIVSRIKALNIAFIGTHQVYPADVLEGEGKWKINNAIRYSASQIALITRLKLKEEGEVVGIRMSVETFKSRFAKLGSKVEVVVPYDTGMNPNSGLVELLERDGVIVKNGGWMQVQFPGEPLKKFQRGDVDDAFVKKLFTHPLITKKVQEFEATVFTETEADILPDGPVAGDEA